MLALYDIHGNIDALEAVLADPRAAGADVVVIGGDAVPGRFAREVLGRIERIELPVHWIRGNGEREVTEALGADSTTIDPNDLALVTARMTADDLGADAARELGTHPVTITLDGVLYCHATPRSDEEMVTRLSPDARWEAVLSDVSEAVVVAGHTHQQLDRTVGAVRYVNAGSVGMPYEGDGAARWALVTDGVPELLSTTYDAEAAGRRMLDAGWPDQRSLDASLIAPVDPIEVTTFFEELAAAQATPSAP